MFNNQCAKIRILYSRILQDQKATTAVCPLRSRDREPVVEFGLGYLGSYLSSEGNMVYYIRY